MSFGCWWEFNSRPLRTQAPARVRISSLFNESSSGFRARDCHMMVMVVVMATRVSVPVVVVMMMLGELHAFGG
jgi:hypothetical protein